MESGAYHTVPTVNARLETRMECGKLLAHDEFLLVYGVMRVEMFIYNPSTMSLNGAELQAQVEQLLYQ